jgi:hypothetical protein
MQDFPKNGKKTDAPSKSARPFFSSAKVYLLKQSLQ